MFRVLIADDHATFRSGLRAILSTQPDFECVAEVADGRAAVAETIRLRPDLAILDVRMPKFDGLAAAAEIVASGLTGVRMLMLTTYDSDEYLHRALTAGVHGFVLKSLPPEELIAAVRAAARGDAYVDPSVVRRLTPRIADALAPAEEAPPEPPPGMVRLTAREREVFVLLAEGFTNPEIGARLYIGDETVKTHVSRILTKLKLRDRVHAVRYAYRHGIVQVGDEQDL
ncbi:response regulator [Actinomadura madurae]|uniref:DNA-binding response regulator, NarL/FixJ family, contains REC and HTH domains n=1 Tax=Actinomadura madurae TaxID=1993 RepID=A0A1I5YN76_9ACTN|nr:response regulator transcription factor [Actinomadura madurae]SFQ45612.1 DNA-binding response regulator, NarL/FixJ family, contains REC and HTH domains [Actinomadura madurae]SPT52173.1 Response regulator protein vraR [Actinomadura madurae]